MVDLAVYVALTIFALLYSLPFASTTGTVLKRDTETFSNSDLFPEKAVRDSFRKVLKGRSVLTTVSSMKISLIVVLLCVILACLAGYSLSRFKGRPFKLYGSGIMVLQMFPMTLMLTPLFLIYENLHLADTHLFLILGYACLNLPLSVLLMGGSFDTVPYELEESAYMDDGNKPDTLVRVVIPTLLPRITTAGILAFLSVWNGYTFANTFVKNPELVTPTVGLRGYLFQDSNSWRQMIAMPAISIVPSILLLLLMQKYLVQGMTARAVKG